MKLLKQIFYFRGIKIGKKEKIVSRMTVTILLLPFLLLFGLLTYLLVFPNCKMKLATSGKKFSH